MVFDKSRVYTAVNADELKVGSKVIIADSVAELRQRVLKNEKPGELLEVLDDTHVYRFHMRDKEVCTLAYLVEEPAKLKWTDLKIGDIITNDEITAMVTAIYPDGSDMHIRTYEWLCDEELAKWRKVNENND